MATAKNQRHDVSLAIIGSGGAGALTVGNMLLTAAGRAGLYGMMTRSVGPQIRGGEAAALIRLSTEPVECMGASFDLAIAMDWRNANRFAAEMPMTSDSLAIGDPEGGEPPEHIVAARARYLELPLGDLAKEIPGGRPNMIALGLAAGLLGMSAEEIDTVLVDKLGSKGEAAITASRAGVAEGLMQAGKIDASLSLAKSESDDKGRWLVTGNEATGLGAVRGGIRFAAAYPITPATEVLEWLAPALAKVGGTLVQAEDELASINMAIGASFGGTPSITATSGPGLALMIESLGLATASEVPIVVVDVMRGGPSTGIPTKSEQSDLNIAIYGCHGDAPHVVVAPLTIGDCLFTAQWAVHLAESMQVPTIVLSDQFLGQTYAVIERPSNVTFLTKRLVAEPDAEAPYQRYLDTASGISPMSVPGTPGGQYTADGLTHTEVGIPSTATVDHEMQLDKRRRKIEDFDYGDHWASIEGEGELAVVTWGSLFGPAREARRKLKAEGADFKLIGMRLLSPFDAGKLLDELKGASRVLVIEQTDSGQFHRHVRGHCDLPGDVKVLARPGPKVIGPDEICESIRNWRS